MDLLTLFTLDDAQRALLLHAHHEYPLMILSVLVAILASGFALQVSGLIRGAESTVTRQVALLSGSLVLGGGIWAMHFIGMLALDIGTAVSYDPLVTFLSFLPALPSSWLALRSLGGGDYRFRAIVPAGMLIGVGIAAMHYSGMFAMRIDGQIHLDPQWFAASVVVALSMPVLALWTLFRLRQQAGISPIYALVLGGLCMGLAIAAMHYTGMAAAEFVGREGLQHQPGLNGNAVLSLSIALGIVLLGLTVGAANGFLRYHYLMRKAQNNENRVRAILDTAVDGIITIDSRGLIQSFNRSAEQMFGWRMHEVVGRNVNLLMPSPYKEQHDGYLQHYALGGKPQVIGTGREVTAQHRDGRQFPIRLGVGETRIDGQPVYVGFVTDISARRAMEQSLRESEQQYSSLIANIPGTSFRCEPSPACRVLFISDAVRELTGWSPAEFREGRKGLHDIVHPDDAGRVAHLIEDSVEHRAKYECQYRIIRRDGSERWVSERASVSCDARGIAQSIDGVVLDITEVRLRNAEFEGTVKAIGRAQAVIEFDMQGSVLRMNDNARLLCRLDGEGTGLSWRELFERQDGLDGSFWECLRQGQFQSRELQLSTVRAEERWIQGLFNPILDADGRPFKVVLLATDLSERRQMVKALEMARDKAEQAAAAKSAFLANMSHEIRTPMNAILGFTEVLLDSPLNEQQYQHLRTVDRSARSLLRLLNDILDTAKLDRGAIELETQDFSLVILCRELIDVLQLQAQSKGLSLSLDYDLAREWFKGDALRIHQILMNLLSNAVKFTDRGSVKLEVRENAGGVVLRIIDTGIGIDESRIEQIFAPFSQADASMSRRFGGTGLGTTIARQLTQLMNGKLEVFSRLGEGSVFQVTLPLVPGNPKLPAQMASRTELPFLRILAADDVEENLELLRLLLKRAGHEVDLARNGQEAFDMYCAQPFDLVLMDVQMPVLDGHDATRLIRAHERRQGLPRTPIIALTASVLYQDREQARESGMDGFAHKPLEWAQLVAEISRLLPVAVEVTEAPPEPVSKGLQALNWNAALARWGDSEALLSSVRRFTQQADSDLHHLRETLAGGGQVDVKGIGHKLKGAAANLGLEQVQAAAAMLELKASEETVRLASLVPDVDAILEALAQLHLALENVSSPALRGGDAAPVEGLPSAEAIQECIDALRNGELAEDLIQSILQGMGAEAGQRLRDAVNNFDFDLAVQILETLPSPGLEGVDVATPV